MQLHTQGFGSLQSWQGTFVSEAGETIASAEYSEYGKAATLRLRRGELCMEMVAASPDFIRSENSPCGGSGKICFNGEHKYSFLCTTPSEFDIKTASKRSVGRIVLRTHMDSVTRRFLWAYRQGFSAGEAKRYASWGGIAIGSSYALTSLRDMRYGRRDIEAAGALPLFHAADEAVWASLPAEEQLLVLALSVRHLCGSSYHEKTSLRTRGSCPNVPSYLPLEAPMHASIDPGEYKSRAGESWHSSSMLPKLIILAAWVATFVERSESMLGIAVAATLICLVLLLLFRITDKAPALRW